MRHKISFLAVSLLSLFGLIQAQNFPVTIRVIDQTKGERTSNSLIDDEQNLVAGISPSLKFQGFGSTRWYYPLFAFSDEYGGVANARLSRNENEWIWEATIQAPEGEHWWRPCLKSLGYGALNKNSVYYGVTDTLRFSVAPEGQVVGITSITIRQTTFPVTLKVTDMTKGALTNDDSYYEENIFIEGGKPVDILKVQTDLHKEYIALAGTNEKKTIDWENEAFEFNKGVNISCWISQTSSRVGAQATYFTESDVQKLAALGFDHIRLPVDEKELFSTTMEWNTNTRQLIHNALEWCKNANMRVILDFHILRSHYFNDTDNMTLWTQTADQDKLVEMWKKIAAEYHDYPNSLLAFELLNEPVPPTPEVWNGLLARLAGELRKTEPERLLVLDPSSHSSIGALSSLAVPTNDPNLALSFHFYTPHLITHYQASWMALKDISVPLHYPGLLVEQEDIDALTNSDHVRIVNYYNGVFNKQVLAERIRPAIEKGKQLGLKMHCGEFGCISNTDPQVKESWLKDVIAIFNENKIASSVWGYKANFGVFNENGTVKSQEVMNALTEGGWKLPMYPDKGHVVEKNDTAWIWAVTVHVRTGCYAWRPWVESTQSTINESIYSYDTNASSNGFLRFEVDTEGNISGKTSLVIKEKGQSSLSKETTNQVRVYPTCFDTKIQVKGARLTIEIYNLWGVKLIEMSASPAMTIETSDLPSGVYLLVADKTQIHKIVKQ